MTTGRKIEIKIPGILILCSFIAAHLCFLFLPGIFDLWNDQTADQFFVFRSNSNKFKPVYNNTVVHVDFNNSSIEQLKNLYLSRSHYARVVENLADMSVGAQVFDFIFASRLNPEDDGKFIRATEKAGNVYFGTALELVPQKRSPQKTSENTDTIRYLDQTKWKVSLKGDADKLYEGVNPLSTFIGLAEASRGLGSLSVKFDRDGVLRRVPLLVRFGDGFFPILPLRIMCDFLGVPPEDIIFEPGRHLTLQNARVPGEEYSRDIIIPIDRRGNMIVNYIGPWGRMDHYNFADILHASDDRDALELWRDELQGKIVVISDVSTGSTDIGPVPTDPNFPLSGVHANVLHSILTDTFLREFSLPEMVLVEVLLMAVFLIMAVYFSSLYFSFGAVTLAAVYVVVAGAGFLYGHVILNLVRPLLMIAFGMVALIVYRYISEERAKMEGLRQRDFIRETFGRYLSNEVVEELLGSPSGLKMSGEIREVSFLVSDLRGFTAITSSLPPNKVIDILNRYFECMIDIIGRYRGTVNGFLGDGILAFFGAPLQTGDEPSRAVACAIEMQGALVNFNQEQRRLNLPELAMGIGINTGDAVVGNIGSEKRASYGAVGTPINVAFRIESYTVGGQVLISPGTYAKVKKDVEIQGTKEVQFKGITHPVRLHEVIGMGGDYNVVIPEKMPDAFTELAEPLPVECYLMEGKISSGNAIPANIIRLGEHSAEVICPQNLKAHANLRVLLRPGVENAISEIYAKVLLPERGTADSHAMRLQFTWVPDAAIKYLQKVRSNQ